MPPTMNPSFRPGQRIRCVATNSGLKLVIGKIYTVDTATSNMVTLNGLTGQFFNCRFRLASFRDEKGRFVSANLKKSEPKPVIRKNIAPLIKDGDTVKATVDYTNNHFGTTIRAGQKYVVSYRSTSHLWLKGIQGGFPAGYFVWDVDSSLDNLFGDNDTPSSIADKEPTKPVQLSKPANKTNIIPFPTMAQSTANIPTNLRPGAIYKIVGRGFAHYKKEGTGDFVIMQAYGRDPFLVNRNLLRKAEGEDLEQFIADERALKH
jgi:hypothetical protein